MLLCAYNPMQERTSKCPSEMKVQIHAHLKQMVSPWKDCMQLGTHEWLARHLREQKKGEHRLAQILDPKASVSSQRRRRLVCTAPCLALA